MWRRTRTPPYDAPKGGLRWPLFLAGLTLAVIVGAALVAPWWMRRSEPKIGLSAEELAWVRDHSTWAIDQWYALEDAYAASGGARSIEDPDDVFDTLRACASDYSADVGDAPSGSLEDAEAASREACDATLRVSEGYEQYGGPDIALTEPLDDVLVALLESFRSVEEHLLVDRPLPLVAGRSTQSRVEPRLTAATVAVISRKVDVRCWSSTDWGAVERELSAVQGETHFSLYGVANVWEDRANLSPGTCTALADLVYDRRFPTRGKRLVDFVEALLTYAHELEHLAGARFDELEVECHALQDVRRTSRRLGATRRESNWLARTAWSLYRAKKVSKAYATPKCRNGGPYDLAPESDVWP